MTEKLLTGSLNLNTNKAVHNFPTLDGNFVKLSIYNSEAQKHKSIVSYMKPIHQVFIHHATKLHFGYNCHISTSSITRLQCIYMYTTAIFGLVLSLACSPHELKYSE